MRHGRRRTSDPVVAKPPLAFPGMRIGLLGGSFNPAHEGHLHISEQALKRLGLHAVWWLVTPGNPLKTRDARDSLPRRLASARALARHPRITVTAFETALTSPYAIDTLGFLKRRYPDVHFVWIMGGDNLAQFHRWRHWPQIFMRTPMLVMDRPNARLCALVSPAAQRFASARISQDQITRLALLRPPAWAYVAIPLSYVSSTAIRQARGEGDMDRTGTTAYGQSRPRTEIFRKLHRLS